MIANIAGAEIELSDALGQRMQRWVSQEMNQTYDISSLSNGIYFLTIKKENYTITKQLIIAK